MTSPTVIELAPRPERTPRRNARGGRHLRAVVAPRRPAVPILVATTVLLVSLFGIAVMHALLIKGQLVLDQRATAIGQESEEIEALRLQVAELEAPDRVLYVAQERLGMLAATDIAYVLPVEVADTDERVRAAASEFPTADAAAEADGTATAGPIDGGLAPAGGTTEDAGEGADGTAADATATTTEPAGDAAATAETTTSTPSGATTAEDTTE